MGKENFILVSLDDPKAKKLAQTISNESCKNILKKLSEKDFTESELATKLDLPISTVHYNLQQLVKSGLVVVEEFHYSKKGKEINHYKLANKYVIIAPKSVWGIKEKLREILPVGLIALIFSGAMYYIRNVFIGAGRVMKSNVASDELRTFQAESIKALDVSGTGKDSAVVLSDKVSSISLGVKEFLSSDAMIFFYGACFALILYLIISYMRNKKINKSKDNKR